MPVPFNRVSFVCAFEPAIRTLPDVHGIDGSFTLCEIVEDRMALVTAATSDNYVPLSG